MNTLPYPLYRAEQVRELDHLAVTQYGVAGSTLMARAAEAAYRHLRARWPQARRLAVFCGTGNNGGDAYVLAHLAHLDGLGVRVQQVGDGGRLRGEARAAADAAHAAGVPVQPFEPGDLQAYDLLVDGLLGTGLTGTVSGEWQTAIEAINAARRPVLALDIPSGLAADTGAVLGSAVRATLTVTFIGLKQGLFTGEGPDRCGELRYDNLGMPDELFDHISPSARRLDLAQYGAQLSPRRRTAHKGEFGHVVVIGGERGFGGAARLAGEAAARVGAGLVSVATRAVNVGLMGAGRPELMCHGVETAKDLGPLLDVANVLAIGPGLGRGAWGRTMLGVALETRLPLVLDADALNLLAEEPTRRANWVLTPHPGEAARLLRCGTEEIQADRFAAVAGLEASFGGICLLKGAGTLVQAEGAIASLCPYGNPGMASGGMGDLLTGIIAGLVAQAYDLRTSAELGACLHAAAADLAAREGERGMVASDLFPHLRRLANPVS